MWVVYRYCDWDPNQRNACWKHLLLLPEIRTLSQYLRKNV